MLRHLDFNISKVRLSAFVRIDVVNAHDVDPLVADGGIFAKHKQRHNERRKWMLRKAP